MAQDKRRKKRHPLSGRALICAIDGAAIGECRLKDVSETGAQIRYSGVESLPPEFVLVLSKNGKVRRHCVMVWRSDVAAGVRFASPE